MGIESIDFLKDYTFELPPEQIAEHPLPDRSASRLLVLNRQEERWQDCHFTDLSEYLNPGDQLIINNTRVSKRNLELQRRTGRRITTLFLRPESNRTWLCLARGGGKLRDGEKLQLPQGGDISFVVSKNKADRDDKNTFTRLLPLTADGEPAWESLTEAEKFFESYGSPALPPYIKRQITQDDHQRYQTIYADRPGSVAAPTAGLHFTPEIFDKLKKQKIEISTVNLTVGYGTFAPLKEENFQNKRLHPESYQIPAATALQLNNSSGRKIAVGTTTLRALEANFRAHQGQFAAGDFETDLFILPPDCINSVDGLISNFHLPASSLFLLVCSLAGRELMLKSYHHAIANHYRFYSYGDAMLIL